MTSLINMTSLQATVVYQRAGNDVAVAGLAGSWAGMSVLSTAIAVNALLGLAGEVLHEWSSTHKNSDVQCPQKISSWGKSLHYPCLHAGKLTL
jgi:hypothetical protein